MRTKCLGCGNTPILTSSDCDDSLGYTSEVEQVLLYDDSSLLLVEILYALPHPELDIEVGDALVEYASLQFWFD